MTKTPIPSILIFAISALMLVSCRFNTEPVEFRKFPAEYNLKHKFIELEEHYIHARLHLYDSLIFLTNTPENPYQIHVYDNEFQYIKFTGLVGAGPGEISNPFFAAVDDSSSSLWFLDMGKQVFFRFCIDSILNRPVYFPGTYVPVPPNTFGITQYYVFDERTFSYSDFNVSPLMISYIDMHGMVKDSILLNNLPENFHHSTQGTFLNTFLYQHHPSMNKIVLLHRFSDMMVIIDNKGTVLHTRQGPDMITQIPDGRNLNQISTYDDLQVDEDFIFGLYRGTTVFDENLKINYPGSIHVFNWSGEPVARLNLGHPLTEFILDTLNNRILGFSLQSGNLVKYSLQEFYQHNH